jgi:hypothetical protein
MEATMIEMLVPALVMVAIFVWLMSQLRKRPSLLRQLADELNKHSLPRNLEHTVRFRLPVYSAETVQGKEAEFIRDRLPVKWGAWLLNMLLAFVLVLTTMWWLTR